MLFFPPCTFDALPGHTLSWKAEIWFVRWRLPLIVHLKPVCFFVFFLIFRRPEPPTTFKNTWLTLFTTTDLKHLQESCILIWWAEKRLGLAVHSRRHTHTQNTNNLGQLFQIQLLWTWSQLVSGSGVSLAHTYQLGMFPKQYSTMLPGGLQQNKTLISLNVIVISYYSEK